MAPHELPANLEAGLAARHLSGLDGLRAIAAFLVVFYHAELPFVPAGAGVLAFFVLSGFLITRLMLLEEERSGTVSLRQFYLRRSFRIFPAFYAYYLLFIAIVSLRHRPLHVAQAISAFFYVNNYYQAIHGDPNTGLSHTWSLSIEEQFYLLWPLAFLLLKNNRRRFMALAIGVPSLWIYREILLFGFRVDQSYIYEPLDTRADHLLAGCFLAIALHEKRLGALWRVACASQAGILVTITLLIASVALRGVIRVSDYRDSVEFILQPVLFAVLLTQLIASPRELVARPFNWAWMRYLGKISYSVYLYQQLIVHPVTSIVRGSPAIGALAAAGVTIVAASCSYHFIEQPFLRLRERFG
ncbi:MAG: acyltransferase family protein [Gemmatimonadaceae bacterium]